MGIIPFHEVRILYAIIAGIVAYISFKSIDSIRKQRFMIIHEDVQIWFLYFQGYAHFLIFRIWFLLLTSINLLIVTYIIIRFRLYSIFYQGPI